MAGLFNDLWAGRTGEGGRGGGVEKGEGRLDFVCS